MSEARSFLPLAAGTVVCYRAMAKSKLEVSVLWKDSEETRHIKFTLLYLCTCGSCGETFLSLQYTYVRRQFIKFGILIYNKIV